MRGDEGGDFKFRHVQNTILCPQRQLVEGIQCRVGLSPLDLFLTIVRVTWCYVVTSYKFRVTKT